MAFAGRRGSWVARFVHGRAGPAPGFCARVLHEVRGIIQISEAAGAAALLGTQCQLSSNEGTPNLKHAYMALAEAIPFLVSPRPATA